jgi:hypothetical protein
VANLVDNATAHNVTGGHVWVATAVTDGKAMLTVTNTGPLIPGGEVDRLFQPFQRLDPGRTHHNGHGLGLSTVKAIATAHGATITARPRPGGGLSIQVAFPPPTSCHHVARDETERTTSPRPPPPYEHRRGVAPAMASPERRCGQGGDTRSEARTYDLDGAGHRLMPGSAEPGAWSGCLLPAPGQQPLVCHRGPGHLPGD